MSFSRRIWSAGAATADITPAPGAFLFGYPHAERRSEGVHDPLGATALCLDAGAEPVLLVACDVIWVPQDLIARARGRIAAITGAAPTRILISATHTHSGPVTARMLSNSDDAVVPDPDPVYLAHLENQIVAAAVLAWERRQPARLALAIATAEGIGGNRRHPGGPSLAEVPVIAIRTADADRLLAVWAIVSMHPTVLHEDWRLASGDFFGLARRWLQQHFGEPDLPVLIQMGASGNQSPRHVVRADSIAEATRLGGLLGQAIADALPGAQLIEPTKLHLARAEVELPPRTFPSVEHAQQAVERARQLLEQARRENRAPAEVRSAECDWFGAEEGLTLARAAASSRLGTVIESCMPAEISVLQLGDDWMVNWPGEVFVEFALAVRQQCPRAWVATLSGGDLQGYLVTSEAAAAGGYEATNAVFASPASGDLLVRTTIELIEQLASKPRHALPRD